MMFSKGVQPGKYLLDQMQYNLFGCIDRTRTTWGLLFGIIGGRHKLLRGQVFSET
jgi:hypothetical protein